MKKTILVVEDEPTLTELFRDELSQEGYEVRVARTVRAASEYLTRETPDLVILDIKLPDGSGLSLLEKIRKKREDLPIFICSAYDSFKKDYAVWANKVTDYIVKPFKFKELKEKIKLTFEVLA